MAERIITLGAILSRRPCKSGWRKLIAALGTYDLATRLTIGDVAKANGAEDAMWCLCCIDNPRVRVAAVMPAVKRASAHTTDQRVHGCIAAIERWLAGDDSVDLRAAAEAAARSEAAARAVAWAAAATKDAASAAEAAGRAALAAGRAAEAEAAEAAERDRQRDDLIKMFGLLAMEGK